MKYATLIGITSSALLIGILACMFNYEYLILQWPQHIPTHYQHKETKKSVPLHFWNNHAWHCEQQEILWSDNHMRTIQQLLQYWLRLLEDTNIIHKHISIQSVSTAPNQQDLFISFDQNPLMRDWSVFQKWMFIEGILRTIRSNITGIQAVYFLLRHQPLCDTHLDFSHPWPLTGYL